MSEANLDQVKKMIEQLPSEDRQSLIPFLAELPDSGLQSCDLREELDTLKKFGTKVKPPPKLEAVETLVDLVIHRNIVSVQMMEKEVLLAVFRPNNFIEAFPNTGDKIEMVAETFESSLFTKDKRDEIRSARQANGVQESDAEFEAVIKEACIQIAQDILNGKATRIAEQISLHLPGMVGDMFCAAFKGQTLVDSNLLAQECGKADKE